MPPTTGSNLGLDHSWAVGESGWGPGMDANLKKLDAVVHLQVLNYLNTPPGSPAVGDRYIVGSVPTGAWAGFANYVTWWTGSAWTMYAPKDGWIAWITDEDRIYVYSGSNWAMYAPGVASGTARKLFIPAAMFPSGTVAVDSPSTDQGHYHYINFPAAGDTNIGAWWMVPSDFGALTAFKLIGAMNGTSSTSLTMTWGYGVISGSDFLDELVPSVNHVQGNPGTVGQERRFEWTLTTVPSADTLTAGAMCKLWLHRHNSEDANPDDLRFVGVIMEYTTP